MEISLWRLEFHIAWFHIFIYPFFIGKKNVDNFYDHFPCKICQWSVDDFSVTFSPNEG